MLLPRTRHAASTTRALRASTPSVRLIATAHISRQAARRMVLPSAALIAIATLRPATRPALDQAVGFLVIAVVTAGLSVGALVSVATAALHSLWETPLDAKDAHDILRLWLALMTLLGVTVGGGLLVLALEPAATRHTAAWLGGAAVGAIGAVAALLDAIMDPAVDRT